SARVKFSSFSRVHRICTSPTINLSAIVHSPRHQSLSSRCNPKNVILSAAARLFLSRRSLARRAAQSRDPSALFFFVAGCPRQGVCAWVLGLPFPSQGSALWTPSRQHPYNSTR